MSQLQVGYFMRPVILQLHERTYKVKFSDSHFAIEHILKIKNFNHPNKYNDQNEILLIRT